jgi:hypothetical protein
MCLCCAAAVISSLHHCRRGKQARSPLAPHHVWRPLHPSLLMSRPSTCQTANRHGRATCLPASRIPLAPASVNSSACGSSPPVILPDPPCFSAQTPGSCYCRTSLQVQYASLNDWNQIAPDVWMFSIFLWNWIWALMCCSFLLVSD